MSALYIYELLPLLLLVLLPSVDCHRFHARVDHLGDTVLLPCGGCDNQSGIFQYWVLPGNHQVLNMNHSEPYLEVLANLSLYIQQVEEHHLGDFLCHRENAEGEPWYSRTTLYLYVPGMWEEYHTRFQIGLSAAACFAAIFTTFCVVNSFRYANRRKTKEYSMETEEDATQKDSHSSESSTSKEKSGTINGGFNGYETMDISSIQMKTEF